MTPQVEAKVDEYSVAAQEAWVELRGWGASWTWGGITVDTFWGHNMPQYESIHYHMQVLSYLAPLLPNYA